MALALHHPNPRGMLEEMDGETLMYWIAFLSRKQRQHDKKDYQLAFLAKIIAEMFSKGSGKPLDEYLIKFQTEEERLEEQEAANEAFMNKLPIFEDTVVEYFDRDG